MKAAEARSDPNTESAIRALMDTWARAVAEKDVDAILEHYAEDVRVFDVPPPYETTGRDEFRRGLEGWLAMFDGPVRVEFRNPDIIAGSDIAVLNTLSRVSAEKDGPEAGMWVRVTVCYQKIEGRWLVTHEHASVPFDGQGSVTGLEQ